MEGSGRARRHPEWNDRRQGPSSPLRCVRLRRTDHRMRSKAGSQCYTRNVKEVNAKNPLKRSGLDAQEQGILGKCFRIGTPGRQKLRNINFSPCNLNSVGLGSIRFLNLLARFFEFREGSTGVSMRESRIKNSAVLRSQIHRSNHLSPLLPLDFQMRPSIASLRAGNRRLYV